MCYLLYNLFFILYMLNHVHRVTIDLFISLHLISLFLNIYFQVFKI